MPHSLLVLDLAAWSGPGSACWSSVCARAGVSGTVGSSRCGVCGWLGVLVRPEGAAEQAMR
eukprot:350123-Rhodomonas_salina.1